jgi:hypothetical protein
MLYFWIFAFTCSAPDRGDAQLRECGRRRRGGWAWEAPARSEARRGESEAAWVGVKRTLAARSGAAETPEAASTQGPRPLATSVVLARVGCNERLGSATQRCSWRRRRGGWRTCRPRIRAEHHASAASSMVRVISRPIGVVDISARFRRSKKLVKVFPAIVMRSARLNSSKQQSIGAKTVPAIGHGCRCRRASNRRRIAALRLQSGRPASAHAQCGHRSHSVRVWVHWFVDDYYRSRRNVTSIQRDSSDNVTAINAPGGQ